MIEGNFIETPQAHIKMGKLCWDSNEEPALSVKRGKRDEYEKFNETGAFDTDRADNDIRYGRGISVRRFGGG